ncbi:hypothetical protein MHU86_537 [Fragilaria crotonensis]|nr:hypothetical protein MHU86_537 [Fragilaria crotonensis]
MALLRSLRCWALLLLLLQPLRTDASSSSSRSRNNTSSSGSSSAANDIQLCADSSIEVTGISLLCDSPGTFYYGSGKYRNNQYCKTGDKAKLTVTFDVIGDISEVDPLFTLKAHGDGETIVVYKNARLCYLGTLTSTDGSSCGGYGSFSIATQFYWSKTTATSSSTNSSDSNQLFSPYVSVGFHSSRDPNKYDLGGANTDMCPGSSILTALNEIRERHYGPIASIIWSSLVLIGTLVILGMFAWYLWRRPSRESTDTFARYYADEKSTDEDRKIRLIQNTSGLVAF